MDKYIISEMNSLHIKTPQGVLHDHLRYLLIVGCWQLWKCSHRGFCVPMHGSGCEFEDFMYSDSRHFWNAPRCISADPSDKSTLVQVMAWCHQETNHYLSQCWHRSLSAYGITRSQWVIFHLPVAIQWPMSLKFDIPCVKVSCHSEIAAHCFGGESDDAIFEAGKLIFFDKQAGKAVLCNKRVTSKSKMECLCWSDSSGYKHSFSQEH